MLKGTNRKLNACMLKGIDREQYNTLKKIANDILNEVIPLSAPQFNALHRYKNFIRCLGKGKVSKALLAKNNTVVSKLAEIALRHASHAKTSSGATRRVGKAKKQKLQGYKTSSDSETSSCESLTSEYSSESSAEKSAERSTESSEKDAESSSEKGAESSTEQNGETEWEID